VVPIAATCWALAGCANFWDEVTSNDFKMQNLWVRPDPLVVLRDSKDGDKRARALAVLREPLTNGGTQQQQDLIVKVLTTAATSDEQALCRLAAISSLRNFRDPRAVKALEEAYYRAGYFPQPETSTVIKCQALQALGNTGHPDAIKTLVKVLREPPVAGPDPERQQKLDERIAAARALGKFPQSPATQALLDVMRKEEDVALRARAHDSLQMATGQRLPADPQAWADYLNQSPSRDSAIVHEPSVGEKLLRFVGWDRD
jgi:HEAT repeat protein